MTKNESLVGFFVLYLPFLHFNSVHTGCTEADLEVHQTTV